VDHEGDGDKIRKLIAGTPLSKYLTLVPEGEISLVLEDFCSRVLDRLTAFQSSVRETFQLSDLDAVTGLSSNSHFGGHYVACVDGTRHIARGVVYDSCRAFPPLLADCADWLRDRGSEPVWLPQNYTLGTFVYRQFVNDVPITDWARASFASGELLAICQYLAITDLHHANIVFHNDAPIPIDVETTAQPIRDSQFDQLRPERKWYIHSPFRTMLVTDVAERTQANGFAALFRSQYAEEQFISGYMATMDVVGRNWRKFLDRIHASVHAYPFVRYLVRGTSFYDEIKSFVGRLYYENYEEHQALWKCLDLLAIENSIYPELVPTIAYDAEALVSGDTPYWCLNLLTGELSRDVTSSAVLRLRAPLDWLVAHIRHLSSIPPSEHGATLRQRMLV
jgi:lantibiotic modifying enzyme